MSKSFATGIEQDETRHSIKEITQPPPSNQVFEPLHQEEEKPTRFDHPPLAPPPQAQSVSICSSLQSSVSNLELEISHRKDER